MSTTAGSNALQAQVPVWAIATEPHLRIFAAIGRARVAVIVNAVAQVQGGLGQVAAGEIPA